MPDTIQQELDQLTHASVETIRELLLRGKRTIDEVIRLRERLKQQMTVSDSKILYALSRHYFEEEVASFLLSEIVAHMAQMEKLLGRPVSIKVAALDYWESVEGISDRLELIHEDQLKQLVHTALLDELTGAYTRDFFEYRLAEEVDRAKRYDIPLALLLLDIDHFKKYNDAYGHPAGDDVLRLLGRVVTAGKRESDLFFRYGGEEFALLLPETDGADAVSLGRRLLEAIPAQMVAAEEIHRRVTVSIGISSFDPTWTDPKALLINTDQLLYLAKRNGRDRLESDT